MARRKAAKLPTPTQAMPMCSPACRGGSYAAITRASDRYLAKAEEAIRMASLLWAEVDRGLETTFEKMANEVFVQRQEAVHVVSDLYGDRLNEGVF